MTPKEKAKELVDKFNYFHDKENKQYILFQTPEESKRCALITVDEIMKAPHENQYIELIPSDADNTDWFWDKFDEYWKEVKQEINKL